jgi:hypothetical protein
MPGTYEERFQTAQENLKPEFDVITIRLDCKAFKVEME